jgi:hypothetical protein
LLFPSTSSWPVKFFLDRLIAIFALVGFFLASFVNYLPAGRRVFAAGLVGFFLAGFVNYLPAGGRVFAAGLVGFFPAGPVNVSPAAPVSVFSLLDFFPGLAG